VDDGRGGGHVPVKSAVDGIAPISIHAARRTQRCEFPAYLRMTHHAFAQLREGASILSQPHLDKQPWLTRTLARKQSDGR